MKPPCAGLIETGTTLMHVNRELTFVTRNFVFMGERRCFVLSRYWMILEEHAGSCLIWLSYTQWGLEGRGWWNNIRSEIRRRGTDSRTTGLGLRTTNGTKVSIWFARTRQAHPSIDLRTSTSSIPLTISYSSACFDETGTSPSLLTLDKIKNFYRR